jgi:hypothetical protein
MDHLLAENRSQSPTASTETRLTISEVFPIQRLGFMKQGVWQFFARRRIYHEEMCYEASSYLIFL